MDVNSKARDYFSDKENRDKSSLNTFQDDKIFVDRANFSERSSSRDSVLVRVDQLIFPRVLLHYHELTGIDYSAGVV